MNRIVKTFKDNSYLMFDKGKIDDWCVYVVNSNGERYAPKDIDYLNDLRILSNKYGYNKVYTDFVVIYELTTKIVVQSTLDTIEKISSSYNLEDTLHVNKLFTILYMTMISEENYPNTRLGRKIKRLAIYEILVNNNDVYYSANFMKGMNWRKINELCKIRGF